MKRMEPLSSLSEIKESLPGDAAMQLRNLNIFNMCTKEHFPDEISCITFAQGFGLIPNRESQILHCKGNFCRAEGDKTWKVGFKYRCYNKKSRRKKRCLGTISPFENTFFKGSHLTIHNIFNLVMCFVSRLTVTQVVEQLGLSQGSVIDWYVSCREVCKVILANEFHGMICGEGSVEVDESHLFLWKYLLGRKRKCDDVSFSDEDRNGSCVAESEYRRRYFHDMDMVPLPVGDIYLMFWYHIRLVFPGPGKVGLSFPITDNVDEDSTQVVNSSRSMESALDDSPEGAHVELPLKKQKISPLFQL